MGVVEIRWLKQLEEENAKLKRRACQATWFNRSSQRYRSRCDPQTELHIRRRDLAAGRVRYGYRRLHILLRPEGWPATAKRVCLCRGGIVDQAGGAAAQARLALPRWPARGDDAQRGMGYALRLGPVVRQTIDPAPGRAGRPYARGALDCAESELPGVRRGAETRPASPGRRSADAAEGRQLRAGIRRRLECLTASWFLSVADARERLEAWWRHDATIRPHSALACRPPAPTIMPWPPSPALLPGAPAASSNMAPRPPKN